MRKCRICDVKQIVGNFHKSKRNKDGYADVCKKCAQAYQKRYYEENVAKIKAISKKYREANVEKYRVNSKKYYWANKEKALDMCKKWRVANPNYMSEWLDSNPGYWQAWNEFRAYKQQLGIEK